MATGPTSPKGRHKVSGNAHKHGLRAQKWHTPEEKSDFVALAQELVAEYQPATATEWLMVERIAMGMSKLLRLQAVEDAMYAKARWETATRSSRATAGWLQNWQKKAPCHSSRYWALWRASRPAWTDRFQKPSANC